MPVSEDFTASVLPEPLPDDPLRWAEAWLDIATTREVQRNPNAMTLATATDGRPAARVVLCKRFVADPGYLVFFTNYRSRKMAEIDANADVAVTFHWDALGRQVRIEGRACRSPAGESDAYFSTRSRGSRLGAWASDQSRPIASRDALVAQLEERAAELGVTPAGDGGRADIPRPPHWGGVRVWARAVELWLEGDDRLHDRARWTRALDAAGEHAYAPGPWSGTRLQP